MTVRVRTALIFLLTAGLLAFFLRNADLGGVWAEMRRADPRLLLVALGFTALTYLFRAWRWQYLLRPIGRAPYGPALRATIIGFAASGPLDIPVAIEDEAQFAAIFGPDLPLAWDPERGEMETACLAPAVRSFFRNGGLRAWVVRATNLRASQYAAVTRSRYRRTRRASSGGSR